MEASEHQRRFGRSWFSLREWLQATLPLSGNWLRIVVEERLVGATRLFEAAENAVEPAVEKPTVVADILSILVPPPVRDDEPQLFRDHTALCSQAVRRNYLEIEARNRSLGLAGEEFVPSV